MKPSDFTDQPYSSVIGKSEAETIAKNIMVILKRTGDKFRYLSWEEYSKERQKDGAFTESEKKYFDQVIDYCQSGETAQSFSLTWRKPK